MYKLLTEENKKEIISEYKSRRMNILLALASGVILFSIFAATPSLIYVQALKEAAIVSLQSAESLSTRSSQAELLSYVESFNERLAVLNPLTEAPMPYDLFIKALERKPEAVRVTGLVWQKTSSSPDIKIRGVANSRQDVLSFQSELESSGEWGEVRLPVDVLVRDTEVQFELSLTPK